MLTPDEDQEVTALVAQGWSMSAVARHLGHDRKTIRAHLHSDRSSDSRRSGRPDPFYRFVPYIRSRLRYNPDLPARTLYQELVSRGFDKSYPTLTARLRALQLRPPKLDKPTTTSSTTVQTVARPRHHDDPVDVIVADDEPPQLMPGAARVLLRILLKAVDSDNG